MDVSKFAAQFEQGVSLERVFTDVEFVQDWRAELAPRGYESAGEWGTRAAQNRAVVRDKLGQQVTATLQNSSESIAAYQKIAFERYGKNSTEFEAFLSQIGIIPSGRAAARLIQSLHDFALLNAGSLGSDEVDEAAKSSFFWPFC